MQMILMQHNHHYTQPFYFQYDITSIISYECNNNIQRQHNTLNNVWLSDNPFECIES